MRIPFKQAAKYAFFLPLFLLLYSCENSNDPKPAQETKYARATGDMETYAGSYSNLTAKESELPEEELNITEWIFDSGNPDTILLYASSDIETVWKCGFRKEGIYKAKLRITCKSGNIYEDDFQIKVKPSQPGLIEETALEMFVRIYLSYQFGELTNEILSSVDTLWLGGVSNIPSAKVNNLKGLEYCKNLVNLSLDLQRVSDLAPLAGLTNLISLGLSQNYTITDITPLKFLTNLEFLDLYGNYITDITPLSGMTKLRILNIQENRGISDISVLRNFIVLEELQIGGNYNLDISPIKDLVNLRILYLPALNLDDNDIKENLKNLVNLKLLYLSFKNEITDISVISNMKKLERLYISENKLLSLEGIEALDNLNYIDASHNQLSDLEPFRHRKFLGLIGVSFNNIKDVSPIAENEEIEPGTYFFINNNPLNDKSINEYLPLIANRGIYVYFW